MTIPFPAEPRSQAYSLPRVLLAPDPWPHRLGPAGQAWPLLIVPPFRLSKCRHPEVKLLQSGAGWACGPGQGACSL